MFALVYPATLKRDAEGRWVVSFPMFSGAHTDGADEAEAMAEAVDCLGSVIAFAIADRAEVPEPIAPKRGQRLVPVPLWIVGKLALYWVMREQAVSQSELARRMGVKETIVRRMLDPNHAVRLERIQAALAVLGRRIVMAYDAA